MSLEQKCIAAETLIQYLEEKRRVLLVDIRSFVNYSKCHLDSSINVCVPSTLLRRDNFNIAKLESIITCSQSRQKFKEREGYDAVIYDNECDCSKSPAFLSLLKKFSEDNGFNSVSYLKGGFSSLMEKFPGYCKTQEESATASAPPCPSPSRKPQASEMDEVFDFLYIGSQVAASNKDTLKSSGITHVLNCAKEIPNFFESDSSFSYLKVPLSDCPSQNIDYEMLLEAFNFVSQARLQGGKVLVHCFAGQSRSATLVIAYVMYAFKWSLSKTYSFVQEKRPSVSPNLGFMSQLNTIETKIMPAVVPTPSLVSQPSPMFTHFQTFFDNASVPVFN